MAPKKKNTDSPPSSSLIRTTTDPSPPSEELKSICDRALGFIREGKTINAHKMLSAALPHHDSSAIFHRVRTPVLNHYAESVSDPQLKKRIMQDVVASARRATQLSPNNLEFSVYYIRLLVGASDDHEGFEEAVKECERALAVTNPIDFLLECFREENSSEVDGIARHQEELRFFLKMLKCSILSAECKKLLAKGRFVFRVRCYLDSLTRGEWADLFRVDVKEIKKESELLEEALNFAHDNHTWKFWICPRCCGQRPGDSESQIQHVLKEHLGDSELSEEFKAILPKEVDQGWIDNLVNGRWEPIDVHASTTMYIGDDQEWPLSNDTERRKLLKIIHAHFRMLLKFNYLSMSHLDIVLRYAMGEVKVLPSAKVLLNLGVNEQSMLCIRVLDSLQLQKVLSFLQSLTQTCKIGRYAEPHSSFDFAVLDSPENTDTGVEAFLDDSMSYIDLDLKLLSSSEDLSCPDHEIGSFPDVDRMLYWLYEHLDPLEKYSAWSQQILVRTLKADKILKKLEEECEDLPKICSEKLIILDCHESLQEVKGNCEKEITEVLKEDEFADSILSEVLKEVEAIKISTNSDGETIESETKPNSLDNSSMDAAFRKIEESLEEKLGAIDARIMKNLATTRQLKLNLKHNSAFDYLAVLVPLLQTHLKVSMELTVEELAFFEELVHDPVESMDESDDSQNQIQEPSKGKKKSRKSKKSKGRKT